MIYLLSIIWIEKDNGLVMSSMEKENWDTNICRISVSNNFKAIISLFRILLEMEKNVFIY